MRLWPTLVFVLLSGVPHYLAAQWALASFPSLRARRRAVLAAALILTLAPSVTRTALWLWPSDALASVLAAVMVELFAVALAVVPVAAVSALGRALERLGKGWAGRARIARATGEPVETGMTGATGATGATEVKEATAATGAKEVKEATGATDASVGRRQAIARITGLGAFGASSLVLGWGAVRGRHAFEVEEVVVRVQGWPRALDGYTIAQISDIHVGSFVGERELDEGFEVVARVRPDLVVATGDLVDFVASEVGPLATRLARVGARDGAFAIIGNHDHYAGPAEVARRVAAAGVRLLRNEGVHLRAGDAGGFALLGVDDLQGRKRVAQGFAGPDLGRAIATVAADLPRVLLAHQPLFFREAAGRVALQLSGHTHGGQINPGIQPARLVMPYVEGRYHLHGSTLWVNRGFGVVGPPSRVGAPPEVTKLVIASS